MQKSKIPAGGRSAFGGRSQNDAVGFGSSAFYLAVSSLAFHLLIFFSPSSLVFAAPQIEATPSLALELPAVALLPDSPFYFLKTIWENVSLIFAFNPSKKIELHFVLSERRLSEALASIRRGKADLAGKLLEGASSHLEKAFDIYKEMGKNGRSVVLLRGRLVKEVENQRVLLEGIYRDLSAGRFGLKAAVRRKLEGLAAAVERYGEEKPAEPVFINPLASSAADTYPR